MRALALFGLLLAVPAAAPVAPGPGSEPGVAETLHLAGRCAGWLRDSLAVVEHDADVATLFAALDEGRRLVAEVDRLAANAAILPATEADRRRLHDLGAEAHLHLALLETHAMEFDRAREEIARARSISEHVDGPDFRTPWVALQTGAPGRALVTRYNLLTLTEFEAALGALWDRVRPVPFEFGGFREADLRRINLVRLDSPAPDSLGARLLDRGAAIMRRSLERGAPMFTVPLPPGHYRLRGRPGSDLDRQFLVPEISDLDRVVVDRARFSLQVDPKPGPKGPRFFLNGLEVTDFKAMPYGVYRVKVDEETFPGAPQVVRFVLGEGLSDKTRTTWTINVPGGGTARFQLDKTPIGQRLRR